MLYKELVPAYKEPVPVPFPGSCTCTVPVPLFWLISSRFLFRNRDSRQTLTCISSRLPWLVSLGNFFNFFLLRTIEKCKKNLFPPPPPPPLTTAPAPAPYSFDPMQYACISPKPPWWVDYMGDFVVPKIWQKYFFKSHLPALLHLEISVPMQYAYLSWLW